MSENFDDENISNSQEEEVLETSSEVEEQEADESDDDYQARITKAEELARNYKIRAEKAERQLKSKGSTGEKAETTSELSSKDMFALFKANISEEDIEQVQKFAKMEGLTVAEAVKTDELQAILRLKAEKRQTASVANVGNSKRGSGKVSDEALMAKAQKGEIPDSDEDLERLILARLGKK